MSLDSKTLLDETGWQILCALQENARLTFAELGRRVGLSSPAVAERVQRLEEAGIIEGYRARINVAQVGLPVTAFIRISCSGDNCAYMGHVVKEIPEILEYHRVTGSDSGIMKVVVSSVHHLETLIDRLTPYGTPTTSIVLSSPVPGRIIERSLLSRKGANSANGTKSSNNTNGVHSGSNNKEAGA